MVDGNTLRDDPDFVTRTYSWVSLAGLNRATEHVAKVYKLYNSIDKNKVPCHGIHKVADFFITKNMCSDLHVMYSWGLFIDSARNT